jgi:plastocyanin
MKKTFLLLLFLCGCIEVFSAVHVIMVSNYQFSPKRVNAVVGDVIKWVWVNGSHTTTSRDIPNNAPSWSTSMNSNSTQFKYRLRVAGTYNYICIPHQSAGMVGVIKVTNALTTDLTEMTLDLTSDLNAVINWKTTNDKDIDYYSVQRSNDGVDFTEVGKVRPNGSGAQAQLYSYTDNLSGNDNKYLYYQVEMIDKNGSDRFSEIKVFTQPEKTGKLITSLSPNPVPRGGHLMLQFNAEKEGTLLIQLYNANGNFLKQEEMTAIKGINNGHFHMGDLAPGSYYIVCTSGSKKEKYTVLVK